MWCFNESLRTFRCTLYNTASKVLENHHTLEHVPRYLHQAKSADTVLFFGFANFVITTKEANATTVHALSCATGDDIGRIFDYPRFFQQLEAHRLGHQARYSEFCEAALQTCDERSSRRGSNLSRPTEIILDSTLPHSQVEPLRKYLRNHSAYALYTSCPVSYQPGGCHRFCLHPSDPFALADDNDQNGVLRSRFGRYHDLDLCSL